MSLDLTLSPSPRSMTEPTSRWRNVSVQTAANDVVDRRLVGQLAARDGDGQIERRLRRGVLQGLLMEAGIDEHRRADPEHDRRDRHEEDQRAGQSGPDTSRPAHRVP